MQEKFTEKDIVKFGEDLYEQGEYDLAIEAFTRALLVNDKSPRAWVNLGRALTMNGDLKNAQDAFEHAILLDRSNGREWHRLARLLRHHYHNKSQALYCYLEASKLGKVVEHRINQLSDATPAPPPNLKKSNIHPQIPVFVQNLMEKVSKTPSVFEINQEE